MAARKDYVEIKWLRQMIEALDYLMLARQGQVVTPFNVMTIIDAAHLRLDLKEKLRELERKS